MPEVNTIGVIGIGQIGSRMARRLIDAGFRVVVHDINIEAMNAMQDAIKAASPAEVAQQCDVIITCVTDNASVKDVVLGARGMIERIRANHLVIDTTTSTPATTREVAAVLRQHGADMIDAPVSRGVPAAENGTLSIMVGGREASVERGLAVLKHLGSDIIRTGDVGTGHIAKAMNMMVMGVNFVATMEMILLAESLGIARQTAVSHFAKGEGRSFVLGHHWPRYILPESYDSGFTLGLMWKDLRVADEVVVESGRVALLGSRVASLYRWAAALGMSAQDNTRLVAFGYDQRGMPVPAKQRTWLGQDLLNQLDRTLFAALYLGTLEALIVAEGAGLERVRLLEVLNASSGGSLASERFGQIEVSAEELHEAACEVSGTALGSGTLSFITCLVAQLVGQVRQGCASNVGTVGFWGAFERLTGRI